MTDALLTSAAILAGLSSVWWLVSRAASSRGVLRALSLLRGHLPSLGGHLTNSEIAAHVRILKARRERLTRKSMTLSKEIAHWQSELRRRRAPVEQDTDQHELGNC